MSCEVEEVHVFDQVREDTDLFVIDEVGKMELFSSSFFPAVLRVLESNVPILASVPIPKVGRDIPAGTFSHHNLLITLPCDA
jgi:nucleoside-triphosphatase THEP1